ncbi:MAG: hypothetical protein M3457_14060 [Chloroflexota bacterium]|nr:hypothetical protein [Chloroflexota bacterium]
MVDLIAFPLILSPLTDWSWQQLELGSMLSATVGFLILNAVWAAIFALPLAFISAWWRKIGDQTVGRATPVKASYGDGYTTSYLPLPGRESSSPFAGLYVVTIPIALAWAGIKRSVGALNGSSAGILWRAVGLFTLTFLLITGLMAAMFGMASYWERYDVIGFVSDTLWYGYLDTLRMPKLFPDRWIDALVTAYTVSDQTQYNDWPQYMGQWYRHDEFRTLVWLTAAMDWRWCSSFSPGASSAPLFRE